MRGPKDADARADEVTDASVVEEALTASLRWCNCPVGERYLVGVSGGRDSMVLLHALLRTGYRRLVVCHLDHKLRGRSSQADARLVEKVAGQMNLAVEIGRVDARALAKSRKVSLETAARDARKAFFFDVARARRCRTLLLAHHADDQVETVLFNLCRGSGALGLAGMPPTTEWQAAGRKGSRKSSIRVVRPLLAVWRREVDAYLDAHGVAFREDATNADPAHTRNRMRHEILPALNEVFGREVSRSIWRAADIIGAEEDWMRTTLHDRADQATASVLLPWKELSTATVAEQRRLLRTWLLARGVSGVGYEELERARALLDPLGGPAKVNLPAGLCVRRRAGVLFVEAMNTDMERAAR